MGYRLATADSRQVRGALRKSIKSLKNATNDPFEAASKAFYMYLKDKFTLPGDNLDPAEVRLILNDKLDKEIIDYIIETLMICDAGKYSPDAIEKQNTIKEDMLNMIKQVDKKLK